MASEISGLEKMHGYLKCGNLVARMSLPYIQLESRKPQYIERPALRRPRNAEGCGGRSRSRQAAEMELRGRDSYPMNSNRVRTRNQREPVCRPKGLLRVGQHILTISKPLACAVASRIENAK